MKKLISLLFVLVLIVLTLSATLALPAVAAEPPITISASATTSCVEFSGSTAKVKAAVVVQVLNSDREILAMESFTIVPEDGCFGGSIEKLSLNAKETYTVRVADYDGGPWTSVEVTVPEEPTPSEPSQPSKPSRTVEVPTGGNSATSPKIEATVSGGTATVKDIPAAELSRVGSQTLSLNFSALGKTVDEVKLPAAMMEALSKSASNGLKLKLSTGTVTFDADAIAAISEAAMGKHLTLKLEAVETKSLTAAQKDTVQGLDHAVIIKVTLTSGGRTVSDFGLGSATVTVPYTKKEATATVAVYYLDNSGKLTEMEATYDAATKSVTLVAPHFSEYVLAEISVMPFVDVAESAYYAEAVRWAAANGITDGTDATHFTPNGVVTRAQVVTFLWRTAGKPEPVSLNSFSDVSAKAYYAQAVAWAVENGITAGVGRGQFAPDKACTRAQIVTFLYRYYGENSLSRVNPFNDVEVGKYYYDAVLWAAEAHITDGTSATTFSPADNCLRGQMVTFLYRYIQMVTALYKQVK